MRAKKTFPSVTAALALVAGLQGLALASPPVNVDANGLSLQLPDINQVVVQVQRPDGTLLKHILPATGLMGWNLLLGTNAQDGVYSWEVIPLADRVDETMIWDPANGRDRSGANQAPPAKSGLTRQAGNFLIHNGIYLDEQAEE